MASANSLYATEFKRPASWEQAPVKHFNDVKSDYNVEPYLVAFSSAVSSWPEKL